MPSISLLNATEDM